MMIDNGFDGLMTDDHECGCPIEESKIGMNKRFRSPLP